ncbi:MATE family efflux transporter [uncultured Roseobacter sp.]|uniref:MATE family efflux transporter n=1 Tax=uncultured Roseobacter sp. TaxID=114847 RepID=UPI0034551CCA
MPGTGAFQKFVRSSNWPSRLLGLVSTVAMGAIDTAMLAPLGSEVVAAVGLSTSAFIFVNSAVIGFVSVIGVGIARARGSGHARMTSEAMSSGLAFAVILSLLAALSMSITSPLVSSLAPDPEIASLTGTYWLTLTLAAVPHTMLAAFRGAYTALGRPWTALGITLLGIGLNIPLNQLLIHGGNGIEALGILGAGLASFFAKTLAGAVFVLHWRAARSMRLSRFRFRLSCASILTQAREGSPVAIGSVAEGGAYAATGLMAATLGATELAAYQVVHSIGVLFYMVPIGMMIASSIRTGQVIGAGRRGEVICTLMAANLITLAWSACVLVFVLAFRVPISDVLGPERDVAALAAALCLAMAFVQFADCAQSNALGVLRRMADNVLPNAITVIAYWLLALPFAAFLGLVLNFGVVGLSLGYGLVVLGVAAFLQFRAGRRSKLI